MNVNENILCDFFSKIKAFGVYISGFTLYFMCGFIVVDVLLRNLTATSLVGGYEWVQNYMMPLIIFPSLPYVYSSGIMPRIDMIVDKLPEKLKNINEKIIIFIEILIFFSLSIFTFNFAIDGFYDKAAFSAGIEMYPVYPWYFLAPIGFGMIVIECLFKLFFSNLSPNYKK